MLHLTAALDPASGVPLYEQLYRSIAAEISAGTLPAGARMPGKRSLAEELSVSVNTVDGAYQMLAAEGYLASRPRSGFYVQEYPARPAPGKEAGAPPALSAPPPPAGPPVRYDLSTSGVDTRLFPARTWARLQKELLYTSPGLLSRGDPRGEPELRQALAGYLEEYRGVRCGPEQIVVGAGIEYLLSLLAPLLPGPAAVENPGYPRARQVLENSGRPCRFVPVDEGGLSVAALAASDAAVCYVTPSHQFPTGATMPAPRRAELLGWAAQRPGGRYIIEDDYDSEFRFDTRPLPSLQGMAGAAGPVIYLSTVARSRVAYKARRTALAGALEQAFGPAAALSGLHTGLHLLLRLRGENVPPDTVLAAAARQAGIRLSALSSYYMDDSASCPPGTLVLGYGALDDALCAPLAAALSETLKKACTASSAPSSGR